VLLVFVGSVVEKSLHFATESHLPHHALAQSCEWGEESDDPIGPADAQDAAHETGRDINEDDHDPHPWAEHERQIHHRRGGAPVLLALAPAGTFLLPKPPDEGVAGPVEESLRPPQLPDLELASPRGPPTA
jgi:hypothetical protein